MRSSLGTYYEFSNRSIPAGKGNVRSRIELTEMVIISDCKNPKTANLYTANNTAEIQNVNNYYSFGMPMHRRNYTSGAGAYRFGFNGQEKVDEISGEGNHNTAEFWEYDTRLGRRWNVDPKGEDYPWQSPYSVFNNNPVSFVDEEGLEGDDPNPVVGINKNTGKDVRQKTDVSKLKLNLRAKVINIVVIGTGKAKNDADPTTGWKASDKTDENTVALYVDNAGDLDKMLKQIRTQYGKEVGNIIFVSHGDPNNSMFFIGSTVINDAKDLDFLKDDLSKKSIIMATACHTGSLKIGGAEF